MPFDRSRVKKVHTLGPTGTNLEAASRAWMEKNGLSAEVVLHETLEHGVERMQLDGSEVLIACIVYPELHTLVFSNLEKLEIVECFVQPTHNMVLASRTGAMPSTIASHPAPRGLVPKDATEVVIVNSNAQAAVDCSRGLVEGCITTIAACRAHDLKVVKDFGALPMGFSVHAPRA